jgi:competence protein ComGC
MKNEQGFTVMELLFVVFGAVSLVVSVYVVYLIVAALQKYISS